MQQSVYVDILFLINFSMDYLCLYLCARIMHRSIKAWRMLIAASLGGLYSVFTLFLETAPLFSIAIDLTIGAIICIFAFCERGRPIKTAYLYTLLFVGISMMTGGCMTVLFNLLNRLKLPLDTIESDGISTYIFAAFAAISGIISLHSTDSISHTSSIKECKLLVTVSGTTVEIFAMSDSGNLAKDPISGKPIVFVDRDLLSRCIDCNILEEFAQGRAHAEHGDLALRLIPINTASGHSTVVALRPQKLIAIMRSSRKGDCETEIDALIAPIDINQSAGGYNAIIPANLIKI